MNKWIKRISLASLIAIGLCTGIVKTYEGDVPKGYKDPIGIPTAGVGHTGPDVIVGKYYSDAIREGWLKEDLKDAAAVVESCAANDIDVFHRAAFISFAFSVGRGKKGVKDGFCVLKKGTVPSHIRYARLHNKAKSCACLKQWVTAGGKKLKGLVKRREAEYKLCMTELPKEEKKDGQN